MMRQDPSAVPVKDPSVRFQGPVYQALVKSVDGLYDRLPLMDRAHAEGDA